MKKILLLNLLFANMAMSNHPSHMFEIKVMPFLEASTNNIKSNITGYECLEMHGLHKATKESEGQENTKKNKKQNDEVNWEPLFDKRDFEKHVDTPLSSPFSGGGGILVKSQLVKINEVSFGFLTGFGIHKINATKKTDFVAMEFNTTSFNNLIAGYIGYSVNKNFDLLGGVGISFIYGEYKVIHDKEHEIHDEVHADKKDLYKDMLAKMPDEDILKTKTTIATKLLLGGEYKITHHISSHFILSFTLPTDLHFIIEEGKKDIFDNKKLSMNYGVQFTAGVSYKIL